MKEEIINANVKSTRLGYEGHGIMTADLVIDYGGSCQGFGGYSLSGDDAMHVFIKGVIDCVGVENWESVAGKYVRVKREAGWNGRIIAIGHITLDKWFDPKKAFNEK